MALKKDTKKKHKPILIIFALLQNSIPQKWIGRYVWSEAILVTKGDPILSSTEDTWRSKGC